jgi:hypothetical protein
MDQTQNQQFVCGCGKKFDNREALQRHEKECSTARASGNQQSGGINRQSANTPDSGGSPMTRGAGGGTPRES